MSDGKVTCSHCLLEFNKNTAITEENEEGETLYFCCHGCHGVYHILQDEGFASFYSRRTDWEPGPPETINVTEDLFKGDLKKVDDFYEITFVLTGIRCASCIWLVENYLKNKKGIKYIRVNYATHKAKVRFNSDEISLNEIINGLNSIGYSPLPDSDSSATDLALQEKKDYFYRFSVGAFFTMQIMLFSVALYAGYFQGISANLRKIFEWLSFALATPVVFYSGFPFMINSIKAFKNKVLNMDTLVFLGSFSAYVYSVIAIFFHKQTYFDTSSMIITLILLGRYIETGAKVKAGNAVARLRSLQPTQIKLVSYDDNNESEISLTNIDMVKPGDFFEIDKGEIIPADANIVSGETEIDESMLTGESKPVSKAKGQMIYAGTLNLNGKIVAQIVSVKDETRLSKIATAVEEAQNKKAPIQNIADKIVAYFVPTIISLSALTFIVWYHLSDKFIEPFLNAISVMVIACPCALGLATPLAILIATGKLTKIGAVVKNGDTIEILSKAKQFFFDKTGTITEGKLKVSEIRSFYNDKETLMKYAASLEFHSNHLISKAIVSDFTENFLNVNDFKEIPGEGVIGIIENKSVLAGNKKLIEKNNIHFTEKEQKEYDELILSGLTVVIVAIDNRIEGFIGLSDNLRENAYEILKNLQNLGIDIIILTGDNNKSANVILNKLNLKNINLYSEISPFEKNAIIKEAKKNNIVAMVGDGINDAPALTEADVGFAIGKGTDIAVESSDIVLLRDDLNVILSALKVSKYSLKIIKQNLFWAFSYNIVTVPLAMAGKIHPVTSAVLMSISSLFVVFNSLRINGIK